MPIFDYVCESCGREDLDVFAVRNNFERKCASCGKMMRRQIAAPTPTFKGSGWTRKFYAVNGKF